MWNVLQEFWLCALLAFLIGLLTAWWAWARYRASQEVYDSLADVDSSRSAQPTFRADPEPEPVPVARATAPVAAAAATVAATGPRIRAAVGDPDNLELIKGVGPKLNALLISLGIRRFDQIAAWTRDEVDEVDAHLGNFKGRIDRDNWIDQAGYLAKGDTAGFEAKYGSLGSEI